MSGVEMIMGAVSAIGALSSMSGNMQAAAERKSVTDTQTANLLASHLVAAAGASGGGVTDPTIQNLLTDISGKGVYNANMDIYNGEANAQQLNLQAQADIYSGQVAAAGGQQRASALQTGAFGSALTSAGTLLSRYGGAPAADAIWT